MNALEGAGPASTWRTLLEGGQLHVQRCGSCGHTMFEPRMFCLRCDEEQLEWVPCSGMGELYALTVVRRKPEHGGDYGVALIDLAEGVRIMARPRSIEDLAIGQPVRVEVEENPNGGHWLRCVKAGEAA